MKRTALVFIGLIFLLSCSSSDQAKVKTDIPKEKMIAILIDIHLLEARAEKIKPLNDTLITLKRQAYDSIYAKHGVSETQFLEDFDAYEQKPVAMDELYQQVIDSISVMEANWVEKGIELEKE